MELIAKVTVICIVVALTALLLERDTPELGLLLTLGAIAVVMGFALSYYREIQEMVEKLAMEIIQKIKIILEIVEINNNK